MTTTQLFTALLAAMITLVLALGAFVKYYLDAKIDYLDAKFNGKIDSINGKIDHLDARFNGKTDSISDQLRMLVDYMMLHEGKIARLEERTSKN
jgi:hypothetical protein